jgi:transcriptional regulator with AAA-type ATPase domain
MTIGRSVENQIHLDDPAVSRQHACLFVGDDVEVEDVESANGTELVRGATASEEITSSNLYGRIEPHRRTKLQPGDSLRIGGALLVLERTGDDGKRGRSMAVVDDSCVLRDPEMRRVYALAERAAASDITVLILGETGVGKELMAEAVYRNSHRRKNSFLKINCAALPESLLEGELFGHERGSFTGAHVAKPGLTSFRSRPRRSFCACWKSAR